MKPLGRKILRPSGRPYSWKIDWDILDTMPTLPWYQLLNLHKLGR